MIRTLLAFLGLAFVVYWLWTSDTLTEPHTATMSTLPGFLQKVSPATVEPLRSWIRQEVHQLESRSAELPIRLKQRALSLTSADLEAMARIALDPEAARSERLMAVSVLGLSDSAKSKRLLQDVTETPPVITTKRDSYDVEIMTRTLAIETLVKRLDSSSAKKVLREILVKTRDPALSEALRQWLAKTDGQLNNPTIR